LFLALVLAVVQVGLFWFALERDWTYAEESAEWAVDSGRLTEANPAWYVSDLEEVLYKSGAPVAFGVVLTVLVAVLAGSGMERKSKVSYTYGRLSVSEQEVWVWQTLYNTLSLLLFWALEVFLMLALCKWYTLWVGPEAASHQTVFLACYRSNFLHDLFPLGDVLCWVRNLLLCLTMGASAAVATYKQRREGKRIVSLENGSIAGGFGEALGADVKIGWPDDFIPHGSCEELEKHYALDVASLVALLSR
jgi:hypothetical protein